MDSKRVYDTSYHWIKLYIKDNKTDKLAIQYSNLDNNSAGVLRKTIDKTLVKYTNEIESKLSLTKNKRIINADVSVPAIDGSAREELEIRLDQLVKLQKANQTDRILIEYNKLDDRILVDDLRKNIDLTLIVRKRETWHLISNSNQF